MTYDIDLNATSLRCPLPLLRTKEALRTMRSGEVLRVSATDPQARHDFQMFCAQSGNALLSETNEQGTYVFLVRKGSERKEAT